MAKPLKGLGYHDFRKGFSGFQEGKTSLITCL
jgi:hypothetical protein